VPDSVTVSIQTDREGFVWVASPEGVARYDGRRWTASDDPAMANSADSLWLDQHGVLWAAFRDHGLAQYDGTQWHVEDHSTGLPSQQIRRFYETHNADGSPTLWALTWDQGLMLRQNDRWMFDPDNAQLPHTSILAMAQTRHIGGHERQWAGSGNEGLWFREQDENGRNGGWQRFRAPGFDPAQVEYLLATEHAGREELWISVFGSGLWRLTDAGMRKWSREEGGLPTNDLYDIAETPLPNGDRAIWVSSRAGLLRIHDDRVRVFDRRHGMPSDVVRGLRPWRSPNGDEVLWLATESGVSRTIIGANPWLTASLIGAHASGVFAIFIEADGRGDERLWVGSSDEGIGLFEQGRWRYFNQANGALPDANVRMIAAATDEAGQRALWVGLRFGYLLRVQAGPVFKAVATPWEKHTGEAVLATLTRKLDGRYEQWFGTRQSGLYRKRDGAWTAFRPDSVVGQWRINKLLEQIDAGGRSWLWATTNQGLARFDGERWALLGRDAGLPDTDLIAASLIEEAHGRPILWLGTTNAGMARVDLSDPKHPAVLPNDLPPPPDLTAYGVPRDSTDRIYICTNNGVQQLTPNAGNYTSHVFTRKDGMVHDECNTNGQFIDAHDRFWTGTLGGLTVYDPQRTKLDALPKTLKIVAMHMDGQAIDGVELHAEPSTKEISVEFALLSWQREGESRFRTQLIGYDAAPGAWTAQNSRSFNALPPGHYVLRVEGRDYAGNHSVPVELPIEMAADWWQRGWARAAFAAMLLLGYAAVLWRTRALKVQRRELELRVAARTTELNIANARLLELSYKDALTGLANRRRLLETLEQSPHDAPHGSSTALIFVDVDYFKNYNDRFGHPAGDEALRSVAAMMRRCAPSEALVARYGGEEFACLLLHTDIAQGAALAEQIRAAVASCDIGVLGSGLKNRVTISAGVACAMLANVADAHQLLRDADMALYQAKRDGRNRVCVLGVAPA
jgi:diguanylate cyclase (GGDEF)-like protein